MSLISNLENLDLSVILNAKAAISVSVDDDGFQLAVTGDLNGVAFGELANIATQIKALNPQDLGKAWEHLLEPILKNIRLENFPITELLAELKTGLEMGGSLLRQFAADPLSVGPQLGMPMADMITQFQNTAKNIVDVPLDDIKAARGIWDDLRKGLPSDPSELAQDALTMLLPFPSNALKNMRGSLNQVRSQLKQPLFAKSMLAPVRFELTQMQAHAQAGNQTALNACLVRYPLLFEELRASLSAACKGLPANIRSWNLEVLKQPAETLFGLANTGKPNGLKFMSDLKKHLNHFESLIGLADEAKAREIMDRVNHYLDSLDAYLKSVYLDRIDQGIDFLKRWVRELFAPLGLRDLQDDIDAFFEQIVEAINKADIGQYASSLGLPFQALSEQLENLDLGQHLDQQIANVKDKIDGVITTINDQLVVINNGLNNLTNEIKAIFQQIANLLSEFGDALEQVNAEIEKLDVEGVTDEVIAALQNLREKGEELLAQAPIPEPMKPLIQQLIDELEKMDLEALIKNPARDALASLDIPAEIKEPLENAMPQLQEFLENVHPDRLTAQLQTELTHQLKAITDLATKSMGDVVSGFFGELQKGLDVLDPDQLVEILRIPYQKILAIFDNIAPDKLLKPATDAYDAFLADLPLTNPAQAAKATQSAVGASGKAIGKAAAAPVKAAASPGVVKERQPESNAGNPNLPELKPGDIIRQLLGKPLGQLRETIANLEPSQATTFLGHYRNLSSELAQDLRFLQTQLSSIVHLAEGSGDALLQELSDLEFDTSYAIESQIELGHLSIETELSILQTFSSTELFAQLGEELLEQQTKLKGSVQDMLGDCGNLLDNIADLLETNPISRLGDRLQNLLDAIDPEPVAAALDSVANTAFLKFLELTDVLDTDLETLINRIKRMIHQYNPALHLQRLREVMTVFWEEMAIINPHFWVSQITPLHQAIRESLSAYDPASWSAPLLTTVNALKTKLTNIDPSNILDLGQLNPFQAQANNAAAIDFTQLGADLKIALGDLTAGLDELDPAQLLTTVDELKNRILDQLNPVIDAIHQELLTLLKSLKYVSAQASASVSVSV